MKNLKTIFIIMILLISCQQTIFADINFQKNNFTKWDGDARRVIYTGRGYFAGEYAPQPNEKCLYYSENGYSWKKLNADIRKKMGLFDGVYGTFPYKKVIETDDLFIVCNTAFKKGESSSRTGTLTVLDKNFNILKEITTERISDISYINGVCYINKYIDYVSDAPRDGIANVVIKQTSYYSTDFENWKLYKEDGGIPHIVNGKEIFIKNDLKDVSLSEDGSYPNYMQILDKDSRINLSENGEVKQPIIYENTHFNSLEFLKDYIFAVPSRKSLYVQDLNNYFAVSKDGVYFTNITLPVITRGYIDDKLVDINGFEIQGFYELENGNLEIVVKGSNDESYEFTVEDLDRTIQTSDIYVQFQDKILGFETPPVIEDGSTLVPMRFLFEQMGADVEWNGETQTATATLDNTAVTFAIDDTNAEVNNTPTIMDVPARLINGKTMVPLRFLSEEMGFDVTWDAESRTAIIE